MKEQNYRGSQNSPKRTPGLSAAPAGSGAQPSKAVGPGSLGPPPALSSSAAGRKPASARTPTHDQIAARAREIWQAKGCKSGQDLQNWHEAEAQLKAEMKNPSA
jgi:hypothetical protein